MSSYTSTKMNIMVPREVYVAGDQVYNFLDPMNDTTTTIKVFMEKGSILLQKSATLSNSLQVRPVSNGHENIINELYRLISIYTCLILGIMTFNMLSTVRFLVLLFTGHLWF